MYKHLARLLPINLIVNLYLLFKVLHRPALIKHLNELLHKVGPDDAFVRRCSINKLCRMHRELPGLNSAPLISKVFAARLAENRQGTIDLFIKKGARCKKGFIKRVRTYLLEGPEVSITVERFKTARNRVFTQFYKILDALGDEESCLALARIAAERGFLKKQLALHYAERALMLAPAESRYRTLYVSLLIKMKKITRAEAVVNAGLALHQGWAAGWHLLARLRVMENRLAEAGEYESKALQLSPENHNYRKALSDILWQQGKYLQWFRTR